MATRITFDAFGVGPDARQDTSRQTGSTARNVRNSPEDPRTTFGSQHSKTGKAMKPTHHFLLNASGGEIQVEGNDTADATTRNEIRMHLGHIAKAFQGGDFNIPMFVHDTVPPGVPEMRRLQKNIQYSFEETPNGGSVVISSTDKEALTAIHQFLRFQIEEHKTGDRIDVH